MIILIILNTLCRCASVFREYYKQIVIYVIHLYFFLSIDCEQMFYKNASMNIITNINNNINNK